MERYFKLSNGTTGRILSSYARPQLDKPELIKLEVPEFEPAKRVNDEWVEDVDQYFINRLGEMRSIVSSRWLDSSRAIASVKEQYDQFKDGSYNSFSEVDTAFDSLIIWLGIQDLIVAYGLE